MWCAERVEVKKVGLGRGAAQGKGRAKKRRRCPDLRGWTLRGRAPLEPQAGRGEGAVENAWPAAVVLVWVRQPGCGAVPFAAQWCFSREACEDRGVLACWRSGRARCLLPAALRRASLPLKSPSQAPFRCCSRDRLAAKIARQRCCWLFLCRRLSLLSRTAALISLADDLVFQVVLRARRWLIGPWSASQPRCAPASLPAYLPTGGNDSPARNLNAARRPMQPKTASTSIDTFIPFPHSHPRAHPLGVRTLVSRSNHPPIARVRGGPATCTPPAMQISCLQPLLRTLSFATYLTGPMKLSAQGTPRLHAPSSPAAISHP